MILSGRNATTLVMIAIFAGACLMALTLPGQAAFMPLLVGVPGLLLSLGQLVLDITGHGGPSEKSEADMARAATDRSKGRSEAVMFGWLGLFTVALIAFGFLIAGPILVLLFVRIASRAPWWQAIVAGLATLLVIWGVFVWLLGMPIFEGLLLAWLGY
jgi:hypothetical protein